MPIIASADVSNATSSNFTPGRIVAGIILALPLFLLASGAASADSDISCSVQRTSDGLVLRWTEVPDAVEYQYKLEVSGQGNKYRRVTGSEAVVELDDGVKGSLSIAPIFSDGSTQRRVKCGSQTATAFRCSVAATGTGLFVSWNGVDGATEYQYQVNVLGANHYNTTTDTSAFVDLPVRTNAEVSVTAVFADGSSPSRTYCGGGSSDADPEPADGSRSCSVVGIDGAILVSWSDVPGAAEYQFKLEVPGDGNRYRRVTGNETIIELPSGTEATIGVNPIFNDGSTLRRVNCGTATAL